MGRQLTGSETGLNAYYTFDNTTKDITGHGNDGILMYMETYVANTNTAVLSVSPATQNVSKDGGTTTLAVSNTGSGTMAWTASVTSGSDWLSITSGASGTNSGTITCAFTANTGAANRTGVIRVTATGASGSPVDVTVTQAGVTDLMAASFDGLGLWVYNTGSASWTLISSVPPENMMYSGSVLYVDFGASSGLYQWNGVAWTQLTTAVPENMATSGSVFYGDFGVSGLWKWDGSWTLLASANSDNIVASASMLYVDFGAAYGLYQWDGAT